MPKSKVYLFCLYLFLSEGVIAQTATDEIFLPFPQEENAVPEIKQVKEDQNSSNSSLLDLKSSNQTNLNPNVKEIPAQKIDEKSEVGAITTEKSKVKAKKKKKKGKGDDVDPTEPPLKRGKALLTRNQKQPAEAEFADSYSKEGESANQSRTENANLFGLDAKNTEGVGLVEKIEDPDAKIKAQFELARSLDRMGNNESEEKAYKEYLKLVTSFPVHPQLTPRTHMAIAVLLFRRQEYRPSLHHLVKIMKEFKAAQEFAPAHYYAGRVYESAWASRDLERAKKFYDMYLKESETGVPTPGNDFRKDATERRRILETPTGL